MENSRVMNCPACCSEIPRGCAVCRHCSVRIVDGATEQELYDARNIGFAGGVVVVGALWLVGVFYLGFDSFLVRLGWWWVGALLLGGWVGARWNRERVKKKWEGKLRWFR